MTSTYQNTLIDKKQLRQLLAWSFTSYDSMQACLLADELKYLGFNHRHNKKRNRIKNND